VPDHDALLQLAEDQLAEDQEAELQLALDHDADDHEAEDHEAESQLDAIVPLFVRHVVPGAQTRAGTPWFAAPLGHERLTVAPTSSWTIVPAWTVRARLTSAYLIWSGLQSGCCWNSSAAAPATCGAANDVPLIFT
jgi:hypothetical protein